MVCIVTHLSIGWLKTSSQDILSFSSLCKHLIKKSFISSETFGEAGIYNLWSSIALIKPA